MPFFWVYLLTVNTVFAVIGVVDGPTWVAAVNGFGAGVCFAALVQERV